MDTFWYEAEKELIAERKEHGDAVVPTQHGGRLTFTSLPVGDDNCAMLAMTMLPRGFGLGCHSRDRFCRLHDGSDRRRLGNDRPQDRLSSRGRGLGCERNG